MAARAPKFRVLPQLLYNFLSGSNATLKASPSLLPVVLPSVIPETLRILSLFPCTREHSRISNVKIHGSRFSSVENAYIQRQKPKEKKLPVCLRKKVENIYHQIFLPFAAKNIVGDINIHAVLEKIFAQK